MAKLIYISRVVVLAAALLYALPAAATVFFDQDFETAVVPLDPNDINTFGAPRVGNQWWYIHRSWGKSNSAGNPFVRPTGGNPNEQSDNCYFTTERAHSGTKSFKADYSNCCQDFTATPNADACNLEELAPTTNMKLLEIWVRFWRYTHNYGMNPNAGANKQIYFHTNGYGLPNAIIYDYNALAGSPPGNIGWSFQNTIDAWDNRGLGPFVPNYNGGWYAGPNLGASAFIPDRWQCYEAHLKFNTITNGVPNSDGVAETWIDGTLVSRYVNWRMQPAAGSGGALAYWGPFIMYRQGASQGSIVYFDDIAMGDERIGCGAIAPPPAPNAPTGIQLTKNWFKRMWAWLLPNWA